MCTTIGQSSGNKETREPCAMKVARTVRRGGGGKGHTDLARILPYLVGGQTLLITRVIDQESQRLMEPAPIVLAVTMKMVHGLSPFPRIVHRKIPALSGLLCRGM
jgi:hypothetical protein